MKNIYWAANFVFFFMLGACTHSDTLDLNPKKDVANFIVPEFVIDEASRTTVEITDKAAVFFWSANDTIGIFPDTDATQARFSMVSGAGTKTATFDGGGWALKPEAEYAAYYPYIPDINLDKYGISVDYTGQLQVSSGNTGHLGAYDFMAATAVVPADDEVCFNFKHLNSLVQLKLKMPKATAYHSVTLKSDQKLFPSKGKYNLMDEIIKIQPSVMQESFVMNLTDVSTATDGQEIVVYLMMPPVDLSGQAIKVIAQGADGLKAEGELVMKKMVEGTAYSFSSVLNVVDEGGLEDDVTVVEKAGTLETILGSEKFNKTELAIKGKLNSDDIALLRRMSGGYKDTTDVEFGVLKSLDLSQATLVAGGSYYLYDGKLRYKITSSDAVDNCMFFGCDGLQTLVLPNGVYKIGEAAVSNCANLKNVIIPESVTEIGVSAFKSSTSLEEVVLPSGLKELGSDVFHSCKGLRRIFIPAGVTVIGPNSFGHCYALKEVVLSEGLKTIASAAFAACSGLEKIVIPNSVTTIGERAFGSCTALVDVKLSSGQSRLGSYVFENCTGLRSVVIPEGMEVVESRAFSGCSALREVTLPATLTSLKDRAFYAAALMKPITVKCYAKNPPSIGTSVWKGGNLVDDSKLYVPSEALGAYKSSSWMDYFGEILPLE